MTASSAPGGTGAPRLNKRPQHGAACGATCPRAQHLPSPSPGGWISRRAQKGSWTAAPGPSSSRLPPSHIACGSAASCWRRGEAADGFLSAGRNLWFRPRREGRLHALKKKTTQFPPSSSFSSLSASHRLANWGGSAGVLNVIFPPRAAWRDNG